MRQDLLWLATLLVVGCSPSLGGTSRSTRSSDDQAHRAEQGAKPWTPLLLREDSGIFLPDFSYAGFASGEKPLPALSPTHNLADFGGLPDDGRDDTAALRAALRAAEEYPGPFVLRLQSGHYVVSEVVFIERSELVLQGTGSGAGGTVIELRRPLAEMPQPQELQDVASYLQRQNKQVHGLPFSPYSWTGGVFWTRQGKRPEPGVPAVVLEGRRGSRTLRVKELRASPGEELELRWFNRFGSDSPVLAEVFGLNGAIAGERLADPSQPLTSQRLVIESIRGEDVTIKEPLRHAVQPGWGADLVAPPQRLQRVGFEHLRVEFPDVPYAGHHLERGFNAFYLTDLTQSYLRDVVIDNADSGILSDRCDHVTLSQVTVTGRPGHYGVHLGDVEAVLVQDFAIDAREEHSLSFNTGARGSVFSRGRVYEPSLDQHRGRNHQNLFDAIVGTEARPQSMLFEHGGADYWGPTHGAFNTFWNIELHFPHPTADVGPIVLSGVDDAGPARIVGLHADVPLRVDYPHAYVEGLNRANVTPTSLYEGQLERRLAVAAMR